MVTAFTIILVVTSVLIVDDNEGFRARARDWLEGDGFTVVGDAVDGRSAIEEVRRHRPQVVLLDVQLPDLSGMAVAAELSREPQAPLVVLTSTRDAADFGDSIDDTGAAGFVPKAELSGEALTALLD